MKFNDYEYEITLSDNTTIRREYILPDGLSREEIDTYVNSRITNDEEVLSKGLTSYKRIKYE